MHSLTNKYCFHDMYSRTLLRPPHKEPKIRFRICGLLTKCKFKMAGYWPSFILSVP